MPEEIVIQVASRKEILEELQDLAERWFRLPAEDRVELFDTIESKLGRGAMADVKQRKLFRQITLKQRAAPRKQRELTAAELVFKKQRAANRTGRL